MMKAIIATCYESNEERVSFVLETFKKRGFETKVYTTNYSHIKKCIRNNVPSEYNAIDTKPYNRNLSLNRIISHRKFAKDLFNYVEAEQPDLIWLMVPANSLIKEAKKYKEIHQDVKLIIDVIDMWPESLPISINKNIIPFNIWKNIRTNNIECADYLVTECNLYQDILKKEYSKEIKTIHWCRDYEANVPTLDLPNDKLSLCYIGSINNIIDVDSISKLITNCDMPVALHVIGEGENKDYFIDTLSKVCEVEYHGAIRQEEKKSEIFSKCHAGLNIYKKNLYIGLTVKSIDYFAHGLPIINNIKGDTWKIIEDNNAGINVDDNCIFDSQTIINMRNNNENIINVFNKYFTKEVFIEECEKIVDEVNK